MPRYCSPPRVAVAAFALGLLFATALRAAVAWTPMTAEEAAQKDSLLEPGAAAEILALHVTIDDAAGRYAEYKYHLRAKIFTAKGVEDFLRHKIYYAAGTSVSGIEARTYKPDGSTIVLDKKTILDQQLVRTDDTKIRAKVVGLPGLEPGCVIEVRWTENHDNIHFIRMPFQDKHPARLVHYDFYAYPDLGLESLAVNYRGPAPKLDSRGRYQLEMRDLKSYQDEPYDLPAVQAKSWLVIWYTTENGGTVEDFWRDYCQRLDQQRNDYARPRKDIIETAKRLTADAATEDEKLRRLYEFCVTKIKNKFLVSSGYTADQRKKLKANESASDTLKNGYGTHRDLNRLFIALARAVDIDARIAMVGDRESFVPNIKSRQSLFLDDLVVAIPAGTGWRFLDPGSVFLPYGLLPPDHEGVLALISDAKKATHAVTPMSPADASQRKRTARLVLSADGDLTGTVTLDYSGHRAFEAKSDFESETVEQRHDRIRKDVTAVLPLAEVTEISVAGAASPTEPLKVSYQLRVPQFADRTGSRLIFQPAVFQRGTSAFFTAEKRANTISFRRSQISYDEILLDLPPGFALEEASAPIPLIDLGPIGRYRTKITLTKGRVALVYQRELALQFTVIPPVHYPEIKRAFDAIH
ncbi:MAG: hypothetical protein RLZZ15_2674, partial [Verrucomicrobiota bacterium]